MRLLLIASILASTTAIACPDLTGNYQVCVDDQGQEAPGVNLVQSTSGGITIYSGTSLNEETGEYETDDIIADGVTRTETLEGEVITSKASCEGDALKLENTYQAAWGETSAVSLIKKNGNALEFTTKGSFQGQTFESKTVCK